MGLTVTYHLLPPSTTPAEEHLTSAERHPGYSVLLLQLLTLNGIDPTVQQAAGILFKNFVKRFWAVWCFSPLVIKANISPNKNIEGADNSVINESDRKQIKTVIVDLMLSVPPHIQKQLAEALSIISNSDFPAQWPELLPVRGILLFLLFT